MKKFLPLLLIHFTCFGQISIKDITTRSPSNSFKVLGVNDSGQASLFAVSNLNRLATTAPSLIITGIYSSVIITNNSYVVSGASGTHNNSLAQPVDFSGANGIYDWYATKKGNIFNGAQNNGIFIQRSDPTWIISFQFSGNFNSGTWCVYKTNVWSSNVSDKNAILGASTTANASRIPYAPDYLSMMTSNSLRYFPDNTASTVTLRPLFTTNTYTISSPIYDPLNSLMNFPTIGPTQTFERRQNTEPINGNATPWYGLFWSPPGTVGLIRRMEVMPAMQLISGTRNDLWLQIFPNYGNNPTNYSSVNSNYMSFNVPWTALTSSKYDNTNVVGGIPGMTWSSDYVDVYETYDSVNSKPIQKVFLKTPILFTNGCFARLVDISAQKDVSTNCDLTVLYEQSIAGTLNDYPFNNWTLHGVNSRFIRTPANAFGETDWANYQVSMFSETNKPGIVIGVWIGMQGLDGPFQPPMEAADWVWISDGKWPPAQAEGEDFLFGPYEWRLPAPIFAPGYGLITVANSFARNDGFKYSVDAYRCNIHFAWFNDITAFITTGGNDAGWAGDITTLYFAPQ